MVTYKEIFQSARRRFSENKIENAYYEAKELFCNVFGKEPVHFKADSYPDREKCDLYELYIKRRLSGEPLQYILGEWEFYSIPIKVGKGVLIPRQDTETLVDTAIEIYKDKCGITVVDLCSGSGCIGLALEKNLDIKEIVLVEKSPDAVKYLKENILLNNSKANIVQDDIFSEDTINQLPMADLIVSNPPYLSSDDMANLQTEVGFEPDVALFGGENGLDFYYKIAKHYKALLNTGGRLIFEVGINQDRDVSDILIAEGYKNVNVKKDLCGVTRVVYGEKNYV